MHVSYSDNCFQGHVQNRKHFISVTTVASISRSSNCCTSYCCRMDTGLIVLLNQTLFQPASVTCSAELKLLLNSRYFLFFIESLILEACDEAGIYIVMQ
jgi:hypothetical protein